MYKHKLQNANRFFGEERDLASLKKHELVLWGEEICESKIFFDLAYKKIKEYPKGKYIVFVAKGFVSKAVGQKKSNVKKFFQLGYDVKIKENPNLKDFEFIIEEEK